MEPKAVSPLEPLAGEDYFCQDKCTSCPLSNGPLLAPFRSIFGERTRASINRTSHHRREGADLEPDPHTPKFTKHKNTSTLGGCSSPCNCSSSAREAIHHHHTGVGYYTTTVARTSINLVSLVLRVRRACL